MIFLTVIKIGQGRTATEIQQELTTDRSKEQAFGPSFTVLNRMSEKKLIVWRKGHPEPRKGGRAPRLYTITELGSGVLSVSLNTTYAIQSDLRQKAEV